MNHLASETSPYLLQHRHNPVHWFAWNDNAWQKAQAENKLVLVSIGYSACHWCHVMEREVFEDDECAIFMNRHFVCIKVDREERPDVDSIYMDAIHLMGGRGGWPLNVFVLPDARPVYGGTYFPKEQWLSVLENLADLFSNEPGKVFSYAEQLHAGLKQLQDFGINNDEIPFDPEFLDVIVEKWSGHWDMEKGGARRAPKFPMPNNLEFLLHYGVRSNDKQALDFVNITLEKMALGGIYDQVGGGFARYSVDDSWKVPHFEKMLYDNAQLLAVYAQAFRLTQKPLYLETIEQTTQWLEREMRSPHGLYYSALDADSEGVEGKFYTWTSDELKQILGEQYEFANRYYAIDREASWEHGQNILLRAQPDETFALTSGITVEEVRKNKLSIDEKILVARSSRVRPGLDNKCITSWNAMLVTAFVEIYRTTGDEKFLQDAEGLLKAIRENCVNESGQLTHIYTDGKASVMAFAEDFAFLGSAALSLYEAGMNEEYLQFSKQLTDQCIERFMDPNDCLFFFTASDAEKLVTRKKEIPDNVISSSNSEVCKLLSRLAKHLDDENYETISGKMMKNILPLIDFGSSYSNWLLAYDGMSSPFREIIVSGEDAASFLKALNRNYWPNALFAASTNESELPLFRNRFGANTAIYVCTGKTCSAPFFSVRELLDSEHA